MCPQEAAGRAQQCLEAPGLCLLKIPPPETHLWTGSPGRSSVSEHGARGPSSVSVPLVPLVSPSSLGSCTLLPLGFLFCSLAGHYSATMLTPRFLSQRRNRLAKCRGCGEAQSVLPGPPASGVGGGILVCWDPWGLAAERDRDGDFCPLPPPSCWESSPHGAATGGSPSLGHPQIGTGLWAAPGHPVCPERGAACMRGKESMGCGPQALLSWGISD